MSDPGFREIHLSGKHVVFLFMAGAVAAVAVFLLGVSVGKGISKPDALNAQASSASTGTPPDPSATPSADGTKPTSNDLDYFKSMQGKSSPLPSASPAASASPSASPEPPPPAPKASPTPTPTPAKPAATTKPAATATGTWYVVVDSFSSRTNANNERAELEKKGFNNVAVFNSGAKTVPYKVRVGPFLDRQAAEAMKSRLAKEGYKQSLISR